VSAATLASDLACALDPVVFSRAAGIDPDPWQAKMLRSRASRMQLNCSRQSGKSTTAAILALHTALYEAPALVLMLSPGQRQSGELFKKCTGAYKRLGRPVPAEAETALTLELDNGSRIVALPGNEATVRSYSGVALLLVDEAARCPDPLYYSVRPMLAVSGGRLITMSTPFGKRGFFWSEWTEGTNWERYEVPATECPRITPEFLAEERASMPPWWFGQEYLCKFGDTTNQLFGYDLVMSAFDPTLQPLWGAS
jgi:Terminase large subunit, T4likevirus-type, N-terminal